MINNKADKPRKKKLQTMILSIFLAVIVWFMVMSLTNPSIKTTVSNLNVRFVGERDLREKGFTITGRADIPPLSVVARGNRSDLMTYMDSIYVQLDVSSIDSAGEYTLTATTSLPTTRISIEKENYSEIPITVEEVETKDIEVTVKQTGALKGKLVRSVPANPTVRITGAKSELEKVEGAIATVDISHAQNEPRKRVTYLLTDSSGALITGNETIETTRSDVEVINTVYDARTLTIEPVLSLELDKLYTLNRDKTSISPAAVSVGVSEDFTGDKIVLTIDKPSSGTSEEYTLTSSDNIYVPQGSETVTVKAQLDEKTLSPPPENNENNQQ